MGREQRRREAKRSGKNINEIKKEEEKNVIDKGNVVKVTIIVIAILAILYLILAIFVTKELDLSTKKNKNSESTSTESSSVTDAILASAIFNQSGEDYYVLFYDFNDDDEKDLANTVSSSLTDKKVYKVDSGSGLNSNYITKDSSNPDAKSLSELKVKSPTLITVSADTISNYVEGIDKIKEYINK